MEMAGDSPSIKSTSGFSTCLEELPGVGGEGIHVATLAFRVHGVEGGARTYQNPDRPVITTSRSLGMLTSMFLRL